MTRLLFVIAFILQAILVNSQSCSTAYSFESGLQNWNYDNPSDSSSTGITQSTSHPTDGSYSANLQFNHQSGKSKAIYSIDFGGAVDFSGTTSIKFDLYKTGQPTQVSISLSTTSSYTWNEASAQSLSDGANTLTFDLSYVSSRSDVRKLSILLFPNVYGTGNAYLDKVQYCSTSSSATSSTTSAASSATSSTSSASATSTGSASTTGSASVDGFVTTSGTHFQLNGCPFYFSGTNNYYLIYKSQTMVNNVINDAAALGLSVIRTWGFIDYGDIDGNKENVYFQTYDSSAKTTTYNDGASGLQHLDYVLYAASQKGIRILLPFVNNWKEFGGMDQYVSWFGATYHDDFYTNPTIKQAYKNYIQHILTRVNTYSGIAYKDDPTIFAWELSNECRCKGTGNKPTSSSCSISTLLSWVQEMSSFIKSLDSKHMVTVGDEGFFRNGPGSGWPYQGSEGVDTVAFLNVTTIDFATAHLYPGAWGQSTSWGAQYITDHCNAAKAVGKPVILEEYGYSGSDRLSVYQSWIEAGNAGEIAGDMFWMLASKQDDGNNYPDYDGFTIYNDGGDVAAYLASHASAMAQKNAGCTPVVGSSTGNGSTGASTGNSGSTTAGAVQDGSTNGEESGAGSLVPVLTLLYSIIVYLFV